MEASLISFFVAVLSGMGVGGGGLFVIYLSMFTSISQIAAQGMNLIFFIFSSLSSVVVQLGRRKICYAAIAFMATFGVLGSVLGAYLTKFVTDEWLRRAFGIMLVSGGIISFRSSFSEKAPKGEQKLPKKQ